MLNSKLKIFLLIIILNGTNLYCEVRENNTDNIEDITFEISKFNRDNIEEKSKAIEKDYLKLKKLIEIKSIGVEQKTKWIFKFLDAYSWNKKENKYFDELKKYIPYPCYSTEPYGYGFCYFDGSPMTEKNIILLVNFLRALQKLVLL
jgi:hypothetical protein